jgi:protein-tyrosine phosphatase
MKKIVKVIFICLGNICRSPLAEGVFRHLVSEAGLEKKIYVVSAGTSGWHIGEKPDPRSIEIAEKHGITLDSLGRKAVSEDFRDFDYIIAMDRNNFSDMQRLPGASRMGAAKLYLMRDFDDIGKGLDVPDPYYGGDDGFRDVYEMLDRSCRNLLDEICKTHNL